MGVAMGFHLRPAATADSFFQPRGIAPSCCRSRALCRPMAQLVRHRTWRPIEPRLLVVVVADLDDAGCRQCAPAMDR